MQNTLHLLDETLVEFVEGKKTLPGKPDVHLLMQWSSRGIKKKRSHERIRLERVRKGGRWCTSREAYNRFCEALTNDQEEKR